MYLFTNVRSVITAHGVCDELVWKTWVEMLLKK